MPSGVPLLLYQPWMVKNLLPVVYLTMKSFLNSSSEPSTRLSFNKKCVFTHVYIYFLQECTCCSKSHPHPSCIQGVFAFAACPSANMGRGKNPTSSLVLVAFSISRIIWRLPWSLIQLKSVVLPFLHSYVVTFKISIPNVWVKSKKIIVWFFDMQIGLSLEFLFFSCCRKVG